MKSRKLLKSRRRLTRRKQAGGAVSRLPPLPAGKTWDLKYLGGHGGLTGAAFLVPDNTYILNLATAGRSCFKKGLSIEQSLYDHGLGIKTSDAIQKALEALLATDKFLKSTNAEYLYDESSDGVNAAYGSRKKTEKTIAFYEPGDLMLDNQLSIFNKNLPYFIVGLYNVVVPKKVVKSFLDEDVVEARDNEFATASSTADKALLYERDHKRLLNIPENQLRSEMFDAAGKAIRKDFRISEVLGIMGPVPADKIRVLFVKACRGPPRLAPTNTKKNLNARALSMRRFSIASRTRTPASVPGAVGGGSVASSTAAVGGSSTAAAVGGGASTSGGASAAASGLSTVCSQRLSIELLEAFYTKITPHINAATKVDVQNAYYILEQIISRLQGKVISATGKVLNLIMYSQLVDTLKILNAEFGDLDELCSML